MVRMQHRAEVRYGYFGEFMTRMAGVNELLRARGLAEFVPWAPMGGKVNEVVLIADYADLASFKNEESAFIGDAEIMAKWRTVGELWVEGAARIELLEPAPQLA